MMVIREVLCNERDQAVALSWLMFMTYEVDNFTQDEIATFKTFIQDTRQVNELLMYGAFEEDELQGIVATKGTTHIVLFYVKNHDQAIYKQLFEYLLTHHHVARITASSSPYLVDTYYQLGFKEMVMQEEQENIYKQMIYIPE